MTSVRVQLWILLALGLLAAGTAATQGAPDHPTSDAVPTVLLQTNDGRREFRFGEEVNLRLQYVASQYGHYVRANESDLKNGHPWQWRCEPANEVINRRERSGRISAESFYYVGAHCREGVGNGGGGGCGDCGGESPLGAVPLSYEVVLNNEIQFAQPGRYSCQVATADVARPKTNSEQERVAIELVSNPVVINLTEDPTWSLTMLAAAREQFVAAHCVGLPDESARCWNPVNAIRFLDTEESLTELVRLYKGVNKGGWQDLLWLGILQSLHPRLARELLEKRMVDSDFSVTTGFLDTLTAMALREDHPELFGEPVSENDASTYHHPTLEILRDYVRQLGRQLPKKRDEALATSLKTYTAYASQSFCEDDPLIPSTEVQKSVAAARQNHD